MEDITTVQDYTIDKLATMTQEQLAKHLGVVKCMVSKYKNGLHTPSLTTAITIYKKDKVVVHPYSEKSLIKEIENEHK